MPHPAPLPARPPSVRPKRPKPIPNPQADHVLRLCREGRLFELERWIASGHNIAMPSDYKQSPLRIAIQAGFHSLVELLLRHEASQATKDEVLATAIRLDQTPIVELALQHGASAKAVPLLDALLEMVSYACWLSRRYCWRCQRSRSRRATADDARCVSLGSAI